MYCVTTSCLICLSDKEDTGDTVADGGTPVDGVCVTAAGWAVDTVGAAVGVCGAPVGSEGVIGGVVGIGGDPVGAEADAVCVADAAVV